LIKETWNVLIAAGDFIVKGVALPPISNLATEKLKETSDIDS